MFTKTETKTITSVVDLTDEHWEQLRNTQTTLWPEWFKHAAASTIAWPIAKREMLQQFPSMRKDWLIDKMKQLAEFEREFLQGYVERNRHMFVVGDRAPTIITENKGNQL